MPIKQIDGRMIDGSKPIIGSSARFSTSVSSPSISAVNFYGDGSNLTGIGSTITIVTTITAFQENATFSTSVSSPSISAVNFYGNGTNLTGIATNDFVNTNFFKLTGGTISGATRINDNLTVFGTISATGTSYFANTVYSTTSALSVVNIGNTGPALYVGNNGTGDIASFYDIDSNIEVLHVGGNNGSFPNVGVKTSTPNVDFTVNGQISANNTIWSLGGNSDNWNSAFNTATTYQNASGSFATNTALNAASSVLLPTSIYRAASSSSTIQNLSSRFINLEHSIPNDGIDPVLFIGERGDGSGGTTVGSLSGFNVTYSETANNLIVSTQFGAVAPLTAVAITSNTNVGIGTVSPNTKLTVVGDISATGNIYGGVGINIIPGTSYIVSLSDNGGIIASTNSSTGLTATVVGTNYPTGFQVGVIQLSSARVALSGQNITINQANGFIRTTRQYSAATLVYTGPIGGWVLFGDISA